jgi:hypothetical protein
VRLAALSACRDRGESHTPAMQFYEDMLETLGLEDAPRSTSSGFLDGEGQGRWLADEIKRDEEDGRWSE